VRERHKDGRGDVCVCMFECLVSWCVRALVCVRELGMFDGGREHMSLHIHSVYVCARMHARACV